MRTNITVPLRDRYGNIPSSSSIYCMGQGKYHPRSDEADHFVSSSGTSGSRRRTDPAQYSETQRKVSKCGR